ncbi:ead/Ea22-like family protein [Serratia fonticola]|uniref:ead/Ea22-like family protein n=1 Tax=Serratia fonticola TaxID=47917 RepID=UPI0011610BD8|nr:ead/Ea22-like family protein [Serratia fonticola]
MAEAFADQFKSSGAVNYLELLFEHCDLGQLTVTMQRANGLTPAQKLAAAEQRECHLKASVDVLSAKNADLEQRLQQPALADVMAERHRQISAEGWTPNHDDQHTSSEMAGAAACYASHVNARGWVYSRNPSDYQSETESSNWPWDASWWKPTNPRRDLVKAGALILAEIERLDRAAAKVEGE